MKLDESTFEAALHEVGLAHFHRRRVETKMHRLVDEIKHLRAANRLLKRQNGGLSKRINKLEKPPSCADGL
jgi:hypothetical protein